MGRLIDEDDVKRRMHETMDYQDLYLPVHFEMCMNDAPTVEPASPWHRVEDELPEPHKNVLVSGMEAINNSRVYKVMVNDNGEWRPKDYAPSILWDYWMPIEPPKEDADADK